MMKRNLTTFAGPVLAEVWLRAAGERLKLEWELLASILCDPREGLTLAYLSDVDAATFIESGLQTIYCAAAAVQLSGPTPPHPQLDAREAHRFRIYSLAKRALIEADAWEAGSRQWYGPKWSDDSLSALFDWDFATLFVPIRARLLGELSARQREASEHLRYAWKILGGYSEAAR